LGDTPFVITVKVQVHLPLKHVETVVDKVKSDKWSKWARYKCYLTGPVICVKAKVRNILVNAILVKDVA
jgi:hypothetical protein